MGSYCHRVPEAQSVSLHNSCQNHKECFTQTILSDYMSNSIWIHPLYQAHNLLGISIYREDLHKESLVDTAKCQINEEYLTAVRFLSPGPNGHILDKYW